MSDIFIASKLLPEFDINSNVLQKFIKLFHQLMKTHPENNLRIVRLVNGILSTEAGSISRLIKTGGMAKNWTIDRKSWVYIFYDKLNETLLFKNTLDDHIRFMNLIFFEKALEFDQGEIIGIYLWARKGPDKNTQYRLLSLSNPLEILIKILYLIKKQINFNS